jgi:hypothetical protein
LVIFGYDTGILRTRCTNYQRMVWIKRDSQVDQYVCPSTKNQDGERGMTAIESWTVILDKGSHIRNFLNEEIRRKISLL